MADNSFLPFNFDFSKILGSGNGGSLFGNLFGGQQSSFGTQMGNVIGGAPAASPGLFSRQSLFGGTDPNTGITTGGWAPVALGAGQAVFGALQGNKATKLAENQFKESVRQFDLNFNAQRKSINTELEDRQRARVASNSSAYESVDSYLKKNAV
ncbi:hypothetical protein HOT57_gp09 [Pseudomonas phage phCDa]|uniref:Uncharacterized protein n=1 Tax=Pseudomonas phage phCDa TaxID=2268587 RepID=A0A2Z5H8X7_9CAUD|nr:hypothetical protein HOT57_gp09 [Pseudomonas phage phCDa]AXC36453.1 hypothetical protein phCDa_9 [Pseudomonas phage phCDa]